jgi:hypothetical protein
MLFRALRFAVATSLALAVWAIASPAWAAPAPYCDDRGASAIAPPPILEAPDVAAQRARLEVPCNGDETSFDASLTRGHGPRLSTIDAPEQAIPSAALPIVPPESVDPLSPPQVERPADGERSRVERPPRG